MSKPIVPINQSIRAKEVRLISPQGTQLGIVEFGRALTLARETGLDLICISASATPPVCKIYEYQKWLYEREKSQKQDHGPKLKEVCFSVTIADGDLSHKVNSVQRFLDENHPVRISLRYSGREMLHKELGIDVLKRVLASIKCRIVKAPTISGNTASAQLAPF